MITALRSHLAASAVLNEPALFWILSFLLLTFLLLYFTSSLGPECMKCVKPRRSLWSNQRRAHQGNWPKTWSEQLWASWPLSCDCVCVYVYVCEHGSKAQKHWHEVDRRLPVAKGLQAASQMHRSVRQCDLSSEYLKYGQELVAPILKQWSFYWPTLRCKVMEFCIKSLHFTVSHLEEFSSTFMPFNFFYNEWALMWRPILACDRMWIWLNLQHMFPNYHEHIRKSICLLPSIRDALKRFRSKCWSSREAECSDSELRPRECLTDMDPTRILGAHSECKAAFLATVGTPLHRPCSCKGLNGGHLLTCSKIHSVFHNRSHFGEHSFDLKAGQSVQRTDFNTVVLSVLL